MQNPGYSGKPICEKLGITPGTVVHVIDAPAEYLDFLQPLPLEVSIKPGKPTERSAFIHLFVTRRDTLQHGLVSIVDVLLPNGTLWISWPKKTANIDSDVTENTLREIALPFGLVDTKVCALSDTWSALKFVWRKDRR